MLMCTKSLLAYIASTVSPENITWNNISYWGFLFLWLTVVGFLTEKISQTIIKFISFILQIWISNYWQNSSRIVKAEKLITFYLPNNRFGEFWLVWFLKQKLKELSVLHKQADDGIESPVSWSSFSIEEKKHKKLPSNSSRSRRGEVKLVGHLT